jgi:hypothetical protein
VPSQASEAAAVARQEGIASAARRHKELTMLSVVAGIAYATLVVAVVMIPLPIPVAWLIPGAAAYYGVIIAQSRAYRRLLDADVREALEPPDILRCPACGHGTFTDAAYLTLACYDAGRWGACLACGGIAVYGSDGYPVLAGEAERSAIMNDAPAEIRAALTAITELHQMDWS